MSESDVVERHPHSQAPETGEGLGEGGCVPGDTVLHDLNYDPCEVDAPAARLLFDEDEEVGVYGEGHGVDVDAEAPLTGEGLGHAQDRSDAGPVHRDLRMLPAHVAEEHVRSLHRRPLGTPHQALEVVGAITRPRALDNRLEARGERPRIQDLLEQALLTHDRMPISPKTTWARSARGWGFRST